jgi:hypothetical protein
LFLGLLGREPWELVPLDDDPAGEVNEGKIDQILLLGFNRAEQEKQDPQYWGFPRLHGGDGVHGIGFTVDVRHKFVGQESACQNVDHVLPV